MLKKSKYTYAGMNQDISKSKRDPRFYFDAQNIRVYSKDSTSTASATNEKGNELVYSLPGSHVIIGHAVIKDTLVLFTTGGGNDKIITIDLNTYSSFELFTGQLGFSVNNLIETEVYIESDEVQKVYWVDGINQLRHINIIHKVNNVQTAYTQTEATLFDSVPTVNFSAPYVDSIDFGGTHTAGMIQYGYNLISKGGSQSAISPLSELYPINKTNGGGVVNEVVGKIFNIKIDEVDIKYDIIRVYALKYTSYNVLPVIGVIAEETIGGNPVFTFSDDGRVIRTITPEEFLFLGGTAFIPETITTKFNRLILGNMKELYFDVTTEQYDTRAYRFPANSPTTTLRNSGGPNETLSLDGGVFKLTPSLGLPHAVPEDHDCITDFGTTNLYQINSSSYGASGENITISCVTTNQGGGRNVLKSGEIYRIGIEFYNNRGQASTPKWICDIKVPRNNLIGYYNVLSVQLNNTEKLTEAGVVGWRVLRVERTEADKTILAQGIVNPMIFQNYTPPIIRDSQTIPLSTGRTLADQFKLKMPSPFMRNLTNLGETGNSNIKIYAMKHGGVIQQRQDGQYNDSHEDPKGEIFCAGSGNGTNTQNSFQETRLFQMYSPEFIFGTITPINSLKYKIIGSATNTIQNCSEWAKQYHTDTQMVRAELKRNAVASLYLSNINSSIDSENNDEFNQNSRIGGVGGRLAQNKYQYYRKYNFSGFSNSPETEYSILDTPILVGRGESNLTYNGDTSKYQFNNNLYTIIADRNEKDSDCLGIVSVNSETVPSLTIVDSGSSYLEDKLNSVLNTTSNSTGLIEITRILTNQYGGNTYEARSRNSYMRIGKYFRMTDPFSQTIMEAGDTFVGNFSFARIIQNTTQVVDAKYYVMTEIVDFPVETSIDLANRSDASIKGWDSIFMPSFDEYHNYNKVYSQQPIFNPAISTPFTFNLSEEFPHRINATKVKVTGELVDSWTDLLVNEEMYLDGKYGDLVKLIRVMDNVYAFQEKAISMLQIQPRVQTVATDGNTIELGTGSVLYLYNYITTSSGSVNPECIFASPNSIYYLDIGNKSINKITGSQITGVSDVHGMHSFLYNNVDYNTLKYSDSVVGVFDQITNDAYITTPTFTIAFNEATNSFTSRYSFIPKRYINTYLGLYTSENGSKIHKHGDGPVGTFYSVKYPSYITFLFNPEPDGDCVFNNLEFKSEVYNNGVDVPKETINKIHCWNEYQDSSEKNLIYGGNITRRYRDWNLFIPRVSSNILQRMRGQWIYCKLTYNNTNDHNLILHDVILSYDSIQKSH